MQAQLREQCANTVRLLAADMVQSASGHPGAPMGLADITLALWTEFLRYNPDQPDWVNEIGLSFPQVTPRLCFTRCCTWLAMICQWRS